MKEAAEILAVAPKTIYSWAYSRSGRLEFVKLGRCLRVVKESVERYSHPTPEAKQHAIELLGSVLAADR